MDIKKVIDAAEDHMTAIYQLADKIGTLSTAALAITVTFAKGLTPTGAGGLPLIIKLSWFCFLTAIIGFVLIFCAKVNIRRRARIALFEENDRAYEIIKAPCYLHVGLWLSTIGFLAGLFSLAIYGFWFF
jgi:uncharacterized membrane protein